MSFFPCPTLFASPRKFPTDAIIARTIKCMDQERSFIGAGGYGSVYKVPYDGKFYAVKVIEHPGQVRKIEERTAKIAQAVFDHPNLVYVYGTHIDYESQTAMVIMEYVDQESAFTDDETLISDRSFNLLSLPEASSSSKEEELFDARLKNIKMMVRDVTQALLHLKKHQYMHRDISPNNVMRTVDKKGKVRFKLVDYDFVRCPASSSGLPERTSQGRECCLSPTGTYEYSAPEVRDVGKDGKSKYSYSADVWSLGMLLYNLTHGKGRRRMSIMREADLRESLKFAPGYPEDLQDLIRKCTKVDPNQRIALQSILHHPFLKR